MKLKIFSLILLVVGCLLLGLVIGLPMLVQEGTQGAVAIIGDADWPTSQFLVDRMMHSVNGCLLLWGIALTVTGLFCLFFTKTVKKHCTIKTSAIAMGTSLVTAAGMVCSLESFAAALASSAFGESGAHPIRGAVSILAGVVCFAVFVGLMIWYYCCREGKKTKTGVALDVFTTLLYIPAFFFAGCALYEILGF